MGSLRHSFSFMGISNFLRKKWEFTPLLHFFAFDTKFFLSFPNLSTFLEKPTISLIFSTLAEEKKWEMEKKREMEGTGNGLEEKRDDRREGWRKLTRSKVVGETIGCCYWWDDRLIRTTLFFLPMCLSKIRPIWSDFTLRYKTHQGILDKESTIIDV